MSDFLGFIVLYICCLPLYIPLIPLSFNYYVLQLQTSDRSIAEFLSFLNPSLRQIVINNARDGKPILLKGNASLGSEYLQYLQAQGQIRWQRWLVASVDCIPIILCINGVFASAGNELRIAYLVIFIFASSFILVASLRFGHRLEEIQHHSQF